MASTVRFGFRVARRSEAGLLGIPAAGVEMSRFSRGGTAGPELADAGPQLSAEPRRRGATCGRPLNSREFARCPDDGRCFGGNAGMM